MTFRIDYLLIAVVAAFLTWETAGTWYELRVSRMIQAERQTCQANQKKTQEVSNALQKRLKDTDARHADYLSCLLRHELQPAGTTGGRDAAASGHRLPDTALDVLGLGAAAERQTSQLIACQEFISKVREGR